MNMMIPELTPELPEEVEPEEPTFTQIEIAKIYASALDSVDLIYRLLSIENRTENQNLVIAQNVEHLEVMISKDIWGDEDMGPLNDAVNAGS
jgi:hypothetical protein